MGLVPVQSLSKLLAQNFFVHRSLLRVIRQLSIRGAGYFCQRNHLGCRLGGNRFRMICIALGWR
jgi:hypothetical protein